MSLRERFFNVLLHILSSSSLFYAFKHSTEMTDDEVLVEWMKNLEEGRNFFFSKISNSFNRKKTTDKTAIRVHLVLNFAISWMRNLRIYHHPSLFLKWSIKLKIINFSTASFTDRLMAGIRSTPLSILIDYMLLEDKKKVLMTLSITIASKICRRLVENSSPLYIIIRDEPVFFITIDIFPFPSWLKKNKGKLVAHSLIPIPLLKNNWKNFIILLGNEREKKCRETFDEMQIMYSDQIEVLLNKSTHIHLYKNEKKFNFYETSQTSRERKFVISDVKLWISNQNDAKGEHVFKLLLHSLVTISRSNSSLYFGSFIECVESLT